VNNPQSISGQEDECLRSRFSTSNLARSLTDGDIIKASIEWILENDVEEWMDIKPA